MNSKKTAREWFYSQGTLEVPECGKCDAVKVYRMKYTGQYIFDRDKLGSWRRKRGDKPDNRRSSQLRIYCR